MTINEAPYGVRRSAPLLHTLGVLFFLSLVSLFASAAEPDFESANRLYEKGDYAGAATAYQSLFQTGRASPALLFNLGNAYFKNGQVGKAIAAYRQAEELAPRDPDIRANLNFARGTVPGNTLRVSPLQRALRAVTLNEIGKFTALTVWALFLLLAAAQWRPDLKPSLRAFTISATILAVLASAWLAQALLDRASNRVAVVIAPTSAVRFGPLEESQISFNVRDGNELRVLSQKDRWLQVADPSNRTGWIPTNDIFRLP
jgi:tetratricopeptide (TPR) repeat protein